MRTWYVNIHFRFENAVNKIVCNNTGDVIGYVEYDESWECFVVRFEERDRLDSKDLAGIVEFMNNMQAEHGGKNPPPQGRQADFGELNRTDGAPK